MDIGTSGSPTVRLGTSVVGTENVASSTPTRSEWNFILRNGTEILMRSWGTRVEWYHAGTSDWTLLQSVTTSDLLFGRATLNINADTASVLYFCNGGTGGADVMYKWSGVVGTLASTTANTITLTGSTSLANLGYTATGSVIINGTARVYTGLSGQTFTGVTTDPTGEANGSGVAQVPINATSGESAPQGNILLTDATRLFVAGIKGRESEVRYSNLGVSAITWTVVSLFSRVAGDPGRLETPGGNGPVLALAKDSQNIYVVQPYQVTALQFSAPSDNRTSGSTAIFAGDSPMMRTIKPFDGKSQSTGGRIMQSISGGNNGLLFITQDNQILLLSQVDQLSSPELANIGELIQPTLDTALFDRAASIFYRNKFYIACRSSSDTTRNDTIFVYDAGTKTSPSHWDTPYLLSASDFCINDNELHFGSDLPNASYKFITSARTDVGNGFTASIRTWRENFGLSYLPKTTDMFFLDVEMNQATVLELTANFDEDGVSQQKTLTIRGSDTDIVLDNQPSSAWGLNEYGITQFGSVTQLSDLKRCRFYWDMKSNIEFYNLQIEITSTVAGAVWVLHRWGARILGTKLPIKKLIKA